MAAARSQCKERVMSGLARIMDEAYDNETITKTQTADEIVITIRVKHEREGKKKDLFLFANDWSA